MIFARLHVCVGADGRKHLAGTTISDWNMPIGTWVILRKVDDETYELLELGERPSRPPTDAALASFVIDDEDV